MIAKDVGYPLLVGPSYVFGGRAMMVCWGDEALAIVDALEVRALMVKEPKQVRSLQEYWHARSLRLSH